MNKYHNRKVTVNGITFDSQKEADRYLELMLLQKAGQIDRLKLQPEFTLQDAFTTPDGEKVKAIRYRADFTYRKKMRDGVDTYWVSVVEDVKGYRTKEYQQKRKMMLDMGIRVIEV